MHQIRSVSSSIPTIVKGSIQTQTFSGFTRAPTASHKVSISSSVSKHARTKLGLQRRSHLNSGMSVEWFGFCDYCDVGEMV